MEAWREVCDLLNGETINLEKVKEIISRDFEKYQAYPESFHYLNGSFLFLAKVNGEKKLIVYRESESYQRFHGSEVSLGKHNAKLCEMSNENNVILRGFFPFTNPSSHKNADITIGLGDRLGLASAGHLKLIKNRNVFPVLAQQSMRELKLTGRTYDDVIAAASWAVFQEGYTAGFGADGDHLKNPEEIGMALKSGVTMITLDCSEHIDNSITRLSPTEITERYGKVQGQERKRLETKYLEKKFKLQDGFTIEFTLPDLQKIVLIYLQAVQHAVNVYHHTIKNCGRQIDFEISIDETLTSTTPASHFWVASELVDAGVAITSMAPRFCGDFEKGIDYKGNIENFSGEFEAHVKIAQHFGYKISVHSGSDKFSVFPIVGARTGGRYHLKTAGTNWLEAVRVIALKAPPLYRRMHRFALLNLDEARQYYHISVNIAKIPDIETITDPELPSLMDMNDARQVLHITYGLILSAKNPDGSRMFKDDIYATLYQYESDYYTSLQKHIGKHLDLLGVW